MSKQNGQKSDEANGGDQGFLSRWSARKTQIARTAAVPEDNLLKQNDVNLAQAEQENDEEAALSDNELLEKYELPNPNDVNEEAELDRFFDGKTPERLRQMALRRLWRINPFFGFVDDMVEYGEDYTDAATVIDGMQTAYQVGKGYLQKSLSSEESDEAEDSGSEDVSVTDQVNESGTTHIADGEHQSADNAEDQKPEVGHVTGAKTSNADAQDTTKTVASETDNPVHIGLPSQKLGDGAQTNLHDDDLSQSKGITSIERTATNSTSVETKDLQPKRMVFQIKTDN